MDTGDIKAKLLKEKLMTTMSKKRLTLLADIIDTKKPCSLRLIEWFVSSYSQNYKVIYNLNGTPFDVYSSYKGEQMTSYNKRLFDMYRRMEKFTIKLEGKRTFETTVAQLNFFNWVFQNKILEYVLDHQDSIKRDLDSAKPKKKTKKKFYDNVSISRINITINFD